MSLSLTYLGSLLVVTPLDPPPPLKSVLKNHLQLKFTFYLGPPALLLLVGGFNIIKLTCQQFTGLFVGNVLLQEMGKYLFKLGLGQNKVF